jgi:acetyl esterase
VAPLDPGAKAYVDRVNAGKPVWEVTLEEARGAIDAETLEVFGPVDDVELVEDRLLEGGLAVRLYRPAAEGPLPALVYCHGGGWVVGSLDSHDPVCRRVARRTPCLVVSVDYRLAPEHPFPAGLEDAWAATRWLAAHTAELGVDPSRIAVGGDSSGGNLAAVVALRARNGGLPLALQVLVYPVLDHDLDSPGYLEHGVGLNLTRAKMAWYWNQYLAGADGGQPEASPLRSADLSGLAPALVQTAEYDPLYDEGEAYARRLEEAGVPVTLTRYEGQIHGFIRLGGLIDRANEALAEIEAALRATA